jgi:hypothetical protein
VKQRIIAFLKTLQLICTYDRAAVIAGLLSVLTLLAARFGFRLNASDTAYLASFLTAAVAAFTHVHFAAKARAAAAHGEHEKS